MYNLESTSAVSWLPFPLGLNCTSALRVLCSPRTVLTVGKIVLIVNAGRP